MELFLRELHRRAQPKDFAANAIEHRRQRQRWTPVPDQYFAGPGATNRKLSGVATAGRRAAQQPDRGR
ncbi:MAG: hypothetical protein DMF47_07460, partial [Verrucomicrobia bacterium]